LWGSTKLAMSTLKLVKNGGAVCIEQCPQSIACLPFEQWGLKKRMKNSPKK
jgi:hypothetical protein